MATTCSCCLHNCCNPTIRFDSHSYRNCCNPTIRGDGHSYRSLEQGSKLALDSKLALGSKRVLDSKLALGSKPGLGSKRVLGCSSCYGQFSAWLVGRRCADGAGHRSRRSERLKIARHCYRCTCGQRSSLVS